jgi:CubicO group peptidase (beta-lactamase class C family)
MKRTVVLIVGAALCLAAAPSTKPSTSSPLPVADLAPFVDSVMTAEMAREKIPGAGFVFVQDGRVVMSRGYGLANVATRRSSSPESTIWRIGSISKVVTATAVMTLVDQRKVDLDAPVTRYVNRVTIPKTYPEPVTVRHLLTHTAGFDEIRPGTQAETSEGVLPFARFLNGKLIRVRPPGKVIAYSTYGITLAGELVEEVSGETFEGYLKRHIFEPLGMTRSSITVPNEMAGDLAIGYEYEADSLVPQPWEWYHTTPASSVNATVADMARFLLAHLGRGAAGSARILSEKSGREMQRQQITMDPHIPGYCLGFNEDFVGGLRVIEHGGNVAGFSSLMVMIPEARAGFFVVNHLEGSSLRDNLKDALLKRYFPRARDRHSVPPRPKTGTVRPEQFAGKYGALTSCWSCQPPRVWGVQTVTADSTGVLRFAGRRWIRVDSHRFVREDGSGYIVFRGDEKGEIRLLFAGAYWGWQKVPKAGDG